MAACCFDPETSAKAFNRLFLALLAMSSPESPPPRLAPSRLHLRLTFNRQLFSRCCVSLQPHPRWKLFAGLLEATGFFRFIDGGKVRNFSQNEKAEPTFPLRLWQSGFSAEQNLLSFPTGRSFPRQYWWCARWFGCCGVPPLKGVTHPPPYHPTSYTNTMRADRGAAKKKSYSRQFHVHSYKLDGFFCLRFSLRARKVFFFWSFHDEWVKEGAYESSIGDQLHVEIDTLWKK